MSRGSSAQLTATNGPRRPLNSWMHLANTSFPVPVGPSSNIGKPLGAKRRTSAEARSTLGDEPMISMRTGHPRRP